VLFGFLLFQNHTLAAPMSALPLVIAVQFLFTASLAYALAGLHVTFRDTQYLLGILLMLFFYLAPVFYRPESIPSEYQRVYKLDPLVGIIGAYRQIMLQNEFPDFTTLLWIAGSSLVLLLLTFRLFSHARHRFVEEI
jgi:lipopolysaccharide transport system permease protein